MGKRVTPKCDNRSIGRHLRLPLVLHYEEKEIKPEHVLMALIVDGKNNAVKIMKNIHREAA